MREGISIASGLGSGVRLHDLARICEDYDRRGTGQMHLIAYWTVLLGRLYSAVGSLTFVILSNFGKNLIESA